MVSVSVFILTFSLYVSTPCQGACRAGRRSAAASPHSCCARCARRWQQGRTCLHDGRPMAQENSGGCIPSNQPNARVALLGRLRPLLALSALAAAQDAQLRAPQWGPPKASIAGTAFAAAPQAAACAAQRGTGGPSPSMTAPSCTEADTARSKPGRSVCSRLPASRLSASSARKGHGGQRHGCAEEERLSSGFAQPRTDGRRQRHVPAPGTAAPPACTCVWQQEEAVEAVDDCLDAPAGTHGCSFWTQGCRVATCTRCRPACGWPCPGPAATSARAHEQLRQAAPAPAPADGAVPFAHMSGRQSAPSRLMST